MSPDVHLLTNLAVTCRPRLPTQHRPCTQCAPIAATAPLTAPADKLSCDDDVDQPAAILNKQPLVAFLRGLAPPVGFLLLAYHLFSTPGEYTPAKDGLQLLTCVQLTLLLYTGAGIVLAGLYSLQIAGPMLQLKKKFNFTAAEALLASIAIVHGMWAVATRYLASTCPW